MRPIDADDHCKGCTHYKLTCDLFSEICKYEPKDEPQTCGTCKHMGDYEYCRDCYDYGLYEKVKPCEDAISKGKLIADLADIWEMRNPNLPIDYQEKIESMYAIIKHAQIVAPSRPRGKWIDAEILLESGEAMPIQGCSLCNTFYPLAYTGGGHRYCPNCGADMRGQTMIKCNSCEFCDVDTNRDEAYCEVNDGEQIILYKGQCRPRWCPRVKGADDET